MTWFSRKNGRKVFASSKKQNKGCKCCRICNCDYCLGLIGPF